MFTTSISKLNISTYLPGAFQFKDGYFKAGLLCLCVHAHPELAVFMPHTGSASVSITAITAAAAVWIANSCLCDYSLDCFQPCCFSSISIDFCFFLNDCVCLIDTFIFLTPCYVISLKCYNNAFVAYTTLLCIDKNASNVWICCVHYITLYQPGAHLECGIGSLIVLTSLVSLICICAVYTFFVLSSYHEPIMITIHYTRVSNDTDM